MSATYEPKLTEEQFNDLHKAVDEARKSTELIRISKTALANLLMDHSNLWKRLGEE